MYTVYIKYTVAPCRIQINRLNHILTSTMKYIYIYWQDKLKRLDVKVFYVYVFTEFCFSFFFRFNKPQESKSSLTSLIHSLSHPITSVIQLFINSFSQSVKITPSVNNTLTQQYLLGLCRLNIAELCWTLLALIHTYHTVCWYSYISWNFSLFIREACICHFTMISRLNITPFSSFTCWSELTALQQMDILIFLIIPSSNNTSIIVL